MSDIHNIAIEQCVLAALMTVQNSYETVAGDLTQDCFFSTKHQEVFKAISELADSGKPYDAVLVEQKLNQSKSLVDASDYLMTIMSESPSSFYNLGSYVSELNKLKSHRKVEEIGKKIAMIAHDLNLDDVFAEAEGLFSGSDNQDQNHLGASFEDSIESALQKMIEKAEAMAAGKPSGVRFNLPTLDNLIGTVQKGHLCVVGGRPGSGKSTLAQMLALDTAIKNKGVLFVSAEMDKETLANRMISALSLIPYDELHNARMSSGVLKDFTDAQVAYAKLPIWIEPKQKPTLSEVRTYVRKAERRYKKIGLGCIVIDYLQLLRNPSQRDRIQEVASISRELKSMAKEFECPVIALVQLNRDADKGSRPKSSDIKESGQIEQDADQIVLLHPRLQSEDLMPTGVTEVLVTKNRHGKKGIVLVQDQLDVCRFAAVQVDEKVGGAA